MQRGVQLLNMMRQDRNVLPGGSNQPKLPDVIDPFGRSADELSKQAGAVPQPPAPSPASPNNLPLGGIYGGVPGQVPNLIRPGS
jgi:hypothetical protein